MRQSANIAQIIGQWYQQLDDVQKRQRVRCESRGSLRAIAASAAVAGLACTDREYVCNRYRGAAWQTEIMAYRDDALGVVRLTSYRRQCAHRPHGGTAAARITAAEAERATAAAPGLPVAIAARLTHTGLPGEAYALFCAGGKSAQPYDAAGRRLCKAWLLPPEWQRCGSRWWHAKTRRAAEREIVQAAERRAWWEDYDRTWQEAIREDRARSARQAAKAARRERLLARLSPTLSACWDDALAMHYCPAGVRAWAETHGISAPETARVSLRDLIRDSDPRARALALSVARRAIHARQN
jgi:hypothetical protein